MAELLSHEAALENHEFYRNTTSYFLSRLLRKLGAGAAGQLADLPAQVFASVVGFGGGHPYAAAVADTTPEKYAVLVGCDDIVAAYATGKLLSAYAEKLPATRHECRAVAQDAWAAFAEEAEAEREPGTSQDESVGLPTRIACKATHISLEQVRRIADLAGRMEASLRGAQQERCRNVPEQVDGIELGDDVTRLLPFELCALDDDDLSADALLRLSERRAGQYAVSGRDRKARGPLVVMLDESSSMTGQRNIVAKAAMTALVRIAWESKRPVKVVHFSTGTRVTEIAPRRESHLVKAQSSFLTGGTSISGAMRRAAREVVEWSKAGVRGADVVIISDGGDDGYLGASIASIQDTGGKLFAIAIGEQFRGELRRSAESYAFLPTAAASDASAADALRGAVL